MKHPITVEWSEEDRAWLARIPAMEYCIAFGETPEAAVTEVQIAAEAMRETAKRFGYSYRKASKETTTQTP